MSEQRDGTGTRGHRAQQKAETRRRLYEAAVEVFIEDGPAHASLDKVADRAGVSKATLFFHFGNRMELMAKVGGWLYIQGFPSSDTTREPRTDLGTFLREYLDAQGRPEVRLIWALGDQIAHEYPDRLDAAYWHLVGELELRLVDAGLDKPTAHERSLVVTPALMMVAQRAARDLTTEAEVQAFVDVTCRLAKCPGHG